MRFVLSRDFRVYKNCKIFSSKKACLISFLFFSLFLGSFCNVLALDSGDLIINEVMWKGSYEWIEIYNSSDQDIEIEGWEIAGARTGGASLEIKECKKSPCVARARSYFLIADKESGLDFDLEDSISLKDDKGNGDLILRDIEGGQIDVAKGDEWPAGEEKGDYIFSMERINPDLSGANKDNWASSKEAGGTPKEKNSQFSNKVPEPLSADAGVGIVSQVGREITFDASGSTGKIQEYLWNFGDGREGRGKITTHSFDLSGKYLVSLTVDDGSEKAKDIIEVTIFSSDIFISEFSPDEKWIEIANFSNNIENISGWQITDDTEEDGFIFPENSYISPGSFVLISSSLLSKISFSKDVLYFLYPTDDKRQKIKFDHSFSGLGDIWSIARKGENYFYTKTITKGMENIISGDDKSYNSEISKTEKSDEIDSGIIEKEEKAIEKKEGETEEQIEEENKELFGETAGAQSSLPQQKIFSDDVLDVVRERKKDLIFAATGVSFFSGFFGFGLVRLRRKLKNGKKSLGSIAGVGRQRELIEVEIEKS